MARAATDLPGACPGVGCSPACVDASTSGKTLAPMTSDMRAPALKVLLPLVIACALILPAGASADVRWLDTYERRQDGYIGPVATSTLLADRRYVLTVSGTFSSYSRGRWTSGKTCGKPAARPRFRSPGRISGPTGTDAMWIFADRLGRCRQRSTPIARFVGTQLAVGRSYRRIGTLLPSYSGPRADHVYRFAVIGAGAPARIRIKDPNASDNYGRLRVSVRRAVAADCTRRDYVAFGFSSEQSCAADIVKLARASTDASP